MPPETDGDRLFLLQAEGVQAIVTLASTGEKRTVWGIFEDEHREVDLETASLSTVAPIFHCRTVDLGGVARGDLFRIGGQSRPVRDFHPDGTGMSDVLLGAVVTA